MDDGWAHCEFLEGVMETRGTNVARLLHVARPGTMFATLAAPLRSPEAKRAQPTTGGQTVTGALRGAS
jgi:hypothetical protein